MRCGHTSRTGISRTAKQPPCRWSPGELRRRQMAVGRAVVSSRRPPRHPRRIRQETAAAPRAPSQRAAAGARGGRTVASGGGSGAAAARYLRHQHANTWAQAQQCLAQQIAGCSLRHRPSKCRASAGISGKQQRAQSKLLADVSCVGSPAAQVWLHAVDACRSATQCGERRLLPVPRETPPAGQRRAPGLLFAAPRGASANGWEWVLLLLSPPAPCRGRHRSS